MRNKTIEVTRTQAKLIMIDVIFGEVPDKKLKEFVQTVLQDDTCKVKIAPVGKSITNLPKELENLYV